MKIKMQQALYRTSAATCMLMYPNKYNQVHRYGVYWPKDYSTTVVRTNFFDVNDADKQANMNDDC